MDLNLEEIISKAILKNEEVSLFLLTSESIADFLTKYKMDEKVFPVLAVKGDEQVKRLVAKNPYIPRKEWIMLLFDKNEEVRLEAICNDSHEPTILETALLQQRGY